VTVQPRKNSAHNSEFVLIPAINIELHSKPAPRNHEIVFYVVAWSPDAVQVTIRKPLKAQSYVDHSKTVDAKFLSAGMPEA
jgi:hypothetical protein